MPLAGGHANLSIEFFFRRGVRWLDENEKSRLERILGQLEYFNWPRISEARKRIIAGSDRNLFGERSFLREIFTGDCEQYMRLDGEQYIRLLGALAEGIRREFAGGASSRFDFDFSPESDIGLQCAAAARATVNCIVGGDGT